MNILCNRVVPCALASLLVVSQQASAENIVKNALSTFNLIVGDYSPNDETEGATFVSGLYTPTGNANFGFNTGTVSDDSENILFLNNGVSNSTTSTLQSGSVISRTAVDSKQFILNGNASGTPSVNSAVGDAAFNAALSTAVGSTAGINTASFLLQLGSASQEWSSLSSTGTAGIANNGSYTFTYDNSSALVGGEKIGVFNVQADDIFATNMNFGRFEADFGDAETLIINIGGLNPVFNKSSTGVLQQSATNVIYNFYEAETLTISSAIYGTIYAPLAAITQNVDINGSVVAASLVQNAEIHNFKFDSALPVPEPSTGLLAMLSSCLILFRRRR